MPLSSVVGAQSIVKPGVCTSSTKPASPYDGQVIYMTDVDQTAVWDGSIWVGLERSRDRNIVINGAMMVDQRGTSTTARTTTGYTVDQFFVEDGSDAVVSSQQTTDIPSGQGFKNSLKCTATTAGTATSTNFHVITHFIEGTNSAFLDFGSAAAKTITVSFWVKATVTGTYSFTIYNDGAARIYPASYTINASNTWEKKIITIPGDISGTWLTNTNRGIILNWYMMIGSTYLGTANAWNASAKYGVTGQANAFSSINNIFALTGVQLEAGAVATPFEFENYGTTLRKCQRYYYRTGGSVAGDIYIAGYQPANTPIIQTFRHPVSMRTTPATAQRVGTWSVINTSSQPTVTSPSADSYYLSVTVNASIGNANQSGAYTASSSTYLEFSAEL